jgi:hypothetical protein
MPVHVVIVDFHPVLIGMSCPDYSYRVPCPVHSEPGRCKSKNPRCRNHPGSSFSVVITVPGRPPVPQTSSLSGRVNDSKPRAILAEVAVTRGLPCRHPLSTPVHSFQQFYLVPQYIHFKMPSGILRENQKQLGRPEADLLTVFVVSRRPTRTEEQSSFCSLPAAHHPM